jgi:hypothetical protein
MGAAEADKRAAQDKFLEKIQDHTLADLAGKAPLNVAQSLRSIAFCEAWHVQLLKLMANTPADSAFRDKINARLREAEMWIKKVKAKRHIEFLEKAKERKKEKEISPGFRANMAVDIYCALLLSPTVDCADPLKKAVEDTLWIVDAFGINPETLEREDQ